MDICTQDMTWGPSTLQVAWDADCGGILRARDDPTRPAGSANPNSLGYMLDGARGSMALKQKYNRYLDYNNL